MHLQENTLFDLAFGVKVKVTRNVARYLLHHVTYSGTKFEDVMSYTTARVFVLRIRVSCAFPTHCTCVEFKLRMKRESTYFETHEYSLEAL